MRLKPFAVFAKGLTCRSGVLVERRKFSTNQLCGFLPKAAMKFQWVAIGFALAAIVAGCSKNSPGTFQGYIEGEYIYVASPIGGALTNLAVARGNAVTNGQLLFELEH